MGIGFKPDNSPKQPYNNGKNERIVIEGFRADQIKIENRQRKIEDFTNFCTSTIKLPDYKDKIYNEAKRMMIEEKVDGRELMSSIEKKFASHLITHFKNKPESIFQELSHEKITMDRLIDVGIDKKNLLSIAEPELISLFVNQAKIISGNSAKIDTKNPQVIIGAQNLINLGINKENIIEAIKN